MLKKVFTVFVALLMVLSVLAGCSSPTNKPGDATTAPTPATTEPAAQYQFPWTGDPVTLSYFYVDFRYAGRTYDSLIDKEFQKLLGNITIDDQSVGWADYGTKLDLMFSSGEMPDMVLTDGGRVAKYGSSGFLLDFTPYLELMPNYEKLYAQYPATYKKLDDHIYAIEQPRNTTILSMEWVANGYYVKQGVKIPTTFDEIYESCKQVKALNKDSYPFNYHWGGLMQKSYNTSGSIFYNNDTKKWEYGPLGQNYKDYVAFMTKMYTEQLMPPNALSANDEEWLTQITDPKSWFIYSGYNEVNDLKVPEMVAKESTFSVEYMLPPTAGSNHVWIPIEAQPGTDTYYTYSSSKTKDPEFLCAFLNYMLDDKVKTLVNWGIEGTTFKTNADGTRSFTDDLILPSNPKKGTVDPVKELGLYPHFMCKQMGTVSANDFDAMMLFHVDATCAARMAKYADYIDQNPESAAWNQPRPELTTAESDETSKTLTDLDTYVSENTQLFIMGSKPLTDWDAFIEGLKAIGDGQAVADLFNSKPAVILVNK